MIRLTLRYIFTFFLTFISISFCQAQEYPNKAVRLVVNFPVGGVADQIARVLSIQLQQALGQPFIVENRIGGNGNIGAAEVAKSAADGYTLLLSPSGVISINGFLYSNLSFDPFRDFVPIASQAMVTVFLVVKPGLPVSTMQEFLTYLRVNSGRLNYGSPGSGSSPHLAAEMLKRDAKVNATHIPYKGAAPALTDLMGGQIDFMFDPGVALPQINSGKLRLLAVGSLKRHPAFPDVPTVSEVLGSEFDAGTIFGLLAPKGTSTVVISKLNTEISRIMQTPEMKLRISALGAEPLYLSTTAYSSRLRTINEKMESLVKETNMKAD